MTATAKPARRVAKPAAPKTPEAKPDRLPEPGDIPAGYFIKPRVGAHSARFDLFRGHPDGERTLISEHDSEREAVAAALAR